MSLFKKIEDQIAIQWLMTKCVIKNNPCTFFLRRIKYFKKKEYFGCLTLLIVCMTFKETIYFSDNFVYNQYNLLCLYNVAAIQKFSNFKTEAILRWLKQYKVPYDKIMSRFT